MPYSMPLWTILTKWPAPFGPQWRYPNSAVAGAPLRPGVREIEPPPGASDLEDRIETLHFVIGPPIIMQLAALKPPDAAAGADVDIVDAFRRQLMGAADIAT